MLEIILLSVALVAIGFLVGSLIVTNNEQEKQIAELQGALVEAYTEIEFGKLGILK